MEVNYFQISADLCYFISSTCLKADMQYANKKCKKRIYSVLECLGLTQRFGLCYTVVPPDTTPFRSDFSYYATFFLSTNVLYTVKHPLNATSPFPRHATFKSWHYLATSL